MPSVRLYRHAVVICLLALTLPSAAGCRSKKVPPSPRTGATQTSDFNDATNNPSLTAPPIPLPAVGDPRRDFFDLINTARIKLSRPTLVWDPQIAGAAQAHVDDEYAAQYLDFANPTTKVDVFDRVRSSGVTWKNYCWCRLIWGFTNAGTAYAGGVPQKSQLYSNRYTRGGVGYNPNTILNRTGNWVMVVSD